MNIFAGTGRIIDAEIKGKVLKFNLASEQGKPCFIPCVIFDFDADDKNYIEQLQTTKSIVWLKGRLASYDYEFNGKNIRKVEVVSYASNIKPV